MMHTASAYGLKKFLVDMYLASLLQVNIFLKADEVGFYPVQDFALVVLVGSANLRGSTALLLSYEPKISVNIFITLHRTRRYCKQI